ncbi:MAG: hypothetical protein AVDCRST_MAG71-59, partial [uncultured Lysobacter sp.]
CAAQPRAGGMAARAACPGQRCKACALVPARHWTHAWVSA